MKSKKQLFIEVDSAIHSRIGKIYEEFGDVLEGLKLASYHIDPLGDSHTFSRKTGFNEAVKEINTKIDKIKEVLEQ